MNGVTDLTLTEEDSLAAKGLEVAKIWGPALAACGVGLATGVGAAFACGPLLIQGVMAGLKWLKGKFIEFAGPPVFINDLRLTERYGADIAKVFQVQKETYKRLKTSI